MEPPVFLYNKLSLSYIHSPTYTLCDPKGHSWGSNQTKGPIQITTAPQSKKLCCYHQVIKTGVG